MMDAISSGSGLKKRPAAVSAIQARNDVDHLQGRQLPLQTISPQDTTDGKDGRHALGRWKRQLHTLSLSRLLLLLVSCFLITTTITFMIGQKHLIQDHPTRNTANNDRKSFLTRSSKNLKCSLNDINPHPKCDFVFSSSLIDAWYKEGIPILSSAMFAHPNQQTRLIFSLNDLSDEVYLQSYDANWTCNGQRAKPLGSRPVPPIQPKHRRHVLVVECPQIETELDKVRMDVPTEGCGRSADINQRTILWHDMANWWKCQTQQHPVTIAMENYRSNYTAPNEGTAFVAAATMIQGFEARKLVPQWVEYHRLVLGMDHFFVYLNDKDMVNIDNIDDSSLHHRPYITYIPFGMDVSAIPFFFQQVQQNDILYRLQPYDTAGMVQWIAMTDVDEYIVPAVPREMAHLKPNSPTRNAYIWNRWLMKPWYQLISGIDVDQDWYNQDIYSTTMAGELMSPQKRFRALLNFYQDLPLRGASSKIAGLALPNTFYGALPVESIDQSPLSVSLRGYSSKSFLAAHNSTKTGISICDFTWRRDITPIARSFQRQKLLIRPSRVSYISVHHITHGAVNIDGNHDDTDSITHRLDPWNELRFHHYKLPDEGVHESVPLTKSNILNKWWAIEQTLTVDTTSMKTACRIVQNYLNR